jgi:hypothetical protein
MRTIKEELIWLNEFGSLEDAREIISGLITALLSPISLGVLKKPEKI